MILDPVVWPGILRWATPQALVLSPLVLLPWVPRFFVRRGRGVRFSVSVAAGPLAKESHQRFHYIVLWLRTLVLAALVAALARPQGERRGVAATRNGLDLALVLDVSESMSANDLTPDRLTAAKRWLETFLRRRPDDRVGLVAFSGTPLTVAPLTTDLDAVLAALHELKAGQLGVEGTAIGDGIRLGVTRLLAGGGDGHASRSRVLILATDGANNRGSVPELAARDAAAQGVRVYAIGLGGTRPVPRWETSADGRPALLRDIYGQAISWEPLQEGELRALAQLGGGRFFRAADTTQLAAALAAIDTLEKERFAVPPRPEVQESYPWFLVLALLALGLERWAALTRFRVLA